MHAMLKEFDLSQEETSKVIDEKLNDLNEKFFASKANMHKIINTAINTATSELIIISQKSRPSENKRHIKKLQEHLKHLLELRYVFEELPPEARDLFHINRNCYRIFSEMESYQNNIDEGDLYYLIDQCEELSNTIPDDKGGNRKTGSLIRPGFSGHYSLSCIH